METGRWRLDPYAIRREEKVMSAIERSRWKYSWMASLGSKARTEITLPQGPANILPTDRESIFRAIVLVTGQLHILVAEKIRNANGSSKNNHSHFWAEDGMMLTQKDKGEVSDGAGEAGVRSQEV